MALYKKLAYKRINMQIDAQSVDRYGNRQLSKRQLLVIKLVARGLKNREIAEELGISAQVVRNYLHNIFDKVGLSNRVELALWYEARKQASQPVGKTA